MHSFSMARDQAKPDKHLVNPGVAGAKVSLHGMKISGSGAQLPRACAKDALRGMIRSIFGEALLIEIMLVVAGAL